METGIALAKKRLSALKAEKERAEEKISNLEPKCEELKRQIEEIEEEKEKLRRLCDDKDDELDAITDENKLEAERVSQLEIEVENNLRMVCSHKNVLYNLEQEKEMKENKCNEMQAKLDELYDFDL